MLGTDYEVFSLDSGSHELIPSTVFNLGGKRDPKLELFDDSGQLCGYLHKDNVMLETCTLPAKDGRAFNEAITRSLAALQQWMVTRVPESFIAQTAQQQLSRTVLMMCMDAQELGCDRDFVPGPDYVSSPRRPFNARDLELSRFAGAHIHLSYEDTTLPPAQMAALADLLFAVPLTPLLNGSRAEFYGVRGLHRPTEYPDGSRGVEYRVLDNVWILSPALRGYVTQMCDYWQELAQPQRGDERRALMDLTKYLGAGSVKAAATGAVRRLVTREVDTVLGGMFPGRTVPVPRIGGERTEEEDQPPPRELGRMAQVNTATFVTGARRTGRGMNPMTEDIFAVPTPDTVGGISWAEVMASVRAENDQLAAQLAERQEREQGMRRPATPQGE